jgi:hypothetical protein
MLRNGWCGTIPKCGKRVLGYWERLDIRGSHVIHIETAHDASPPPNLHETAERKEIGWTLIIYT